MKRKIEFTEQELNIVLFALQKQPYEVVAELIKNIATQLKLNEESK